MANQIHVLPDGEQWEVARDSGESEGPFDTQQEAIDLARTIAKDDGLELAIHGRDGQVRQKDSEGNDPRTIPG